MKDTVKCRTTVGEIFRFLFGIILLTGLSGVSFSVPAQSSWTKVLRADGGFFPGQAVTTVSEAPNGDYFAAGYTVDYDAYDLLVLRMASDGRILWQKTYGGAGYDAASWIEATPDGGCILAGQTTSFGDGGFDAWLIKLAADGTIEWQETLGGPPETWVFCIRPTSDGGYIACGDKGDEDYYRLDGMLLKLDSQGGITWERLYGGKDESAFYRVQATSDGGYLLNGATGLTNALDGGQWDPWCAKVDSEGHCEWQMSLPGILWGKGTQVLQTSDGGFVLAGYDDRTLNNKIFIGKLGLGGGLSWVEDITTGYTSWPLGLLPSPDGNILLGAGIQIREAGESDLPWCGLVSVGTDGKLAWNQLFEAGRFDDQYQVIPSSDGGYLFAGLLGLSSAPDIAFRKTDSVGDLPEQCLVKGQRDLQVEPLDVAPVRLVCREWTSSSLVLRSNAAPSVYGCTGLEDSLAVVDTLRWYWTISDLTGCESDPPSYAWDFGDGATSDAAGVAHAYHSVGTYNVHLQVKVGQDVCTNSAKITVLEQPCGISCTSGAEVIDFANFGVQFNAETSVSQCPIQPTYLWNFGDGWGSTEQNPVHYYTAPGLFTWGVTVEAGDAIYTNVGTVDFTHIPACTNSCWANATKVVGTSEAAWFTAGVYGGLCPDVPTVEWDFDGDGTIDATGCSASHVYTQPGNYHWIARVTLDGVVCTKAGNIQVYNDPAPPVVTGVVKKGRPFRLFVNGTNFHPDMQVWIAGAAAAWTQIKQTSTGFVIKKAKSLFPKDGSATTIMLKNGDGGVCAFIYNRKKKTFQGLNWGGTMFPSQGNATHPPETGCAKTIDFGGQLPKGNRKGAPSINRLGIQYKPSIGSN